MKAFNRKIITTRDGSTSLEVEGWGETYHSVHGAIQEAEYVYVQNGCLRANKNPLRILEIGFGSGLNFCLTLEQALLHHWILDYVGVEGFPLNEKEWKALNYGDYFKNKNIDFEAIHRLDWNVENQLTENITLQKVKSLFQEFTSEKHFDVIYYDAFAYNYQPEVWSEELLGKMKRFLVPNGFLVTYACKGVINRTLKCLGYKVLKVPGPKGKREMTIAVNEI